MKRESPSWLVRRIFWPLLGGVWGAWLGFRGYFGVQINADTHAPVFVLGAYAFFALIGLIAGAASCVLIGGFTEKLLRRSGAGIVAALNVATLMNVLALWQIGDLVQAQYPGLRAERAAQQHRGNTPGKLIPAEKGSYRNPCTELPPKDVRERELWDSECR